MPSVSDRIMQSIKGQQLQFMGLPYEGPVPDLKNDDPDWKQPQYRRRVQVEILNLNDTVDMGRYREISQKVGDSLAVISYEERVFTDSVAKVLIRWFEPYYAAPTSEPVTGHPEGVE